MWLRDIPCRHDMRISKRELKEIYLGLVAVSVNNRNLKKRIERITALKTLADVTKDESQKENWKTTAAKKRRSVSTSSLNLKKRIERHVALSPHSSLYSRISKRELKVDWLTSGSPNDLTTESQKENWKGFEECLGLRIIAYVTNLKKRIESVEEFYQALDDLRGISKRELKAVPSGL